MEDHAANQFRVTIAEAIAWASLMAALVGAAATIVGKMGRVEERLISVDRKVSELVEDNASLESRTVDHEYRIKLLEREQSRVPGGN